MLLPFYDYPKNTIFTLFLDGFSSSVVQPGPGSLLPWQIPAKDLNVGIYFAAPVANKRAQYQFQAIFGSHLNQS